MKNKYTNLEKGTPINIEETRSEIDNNIEEETVLAEDEPVAMKPLLEAIVSGCVMLRVRSNPSADAAVVGMLDEGTEITILDELPDWFKMVSKQGTISGYCMRKFTRLKY